MSDPMTLILKLVADHRQEIKADLAQAVHHRERARTGYEQADSRVKALEYLLRSIDSDDGPQETASMTLHDAMVEVLKSDPAGMMRAVHLAASINERGLYRMQDGRLVEGQQVTARVGRYPHLFEREGTFIKLK